MEWNNEGLKSLYDALTEQRPEFNKRGKGAEFKQIFLALAHTFPEDRSNLYAWLSEAAKGSRKASGGANAYRPIVRAAGVKSVGRSSGCVNCPDGLEVGGTSPKLRTTTAGASQLTSAEQVLETYKNDVTLMSAYAQQQGIDTGRATTAEGIAKKIAEYHENTAA